MDMHVLLLFDIARVLDSRVFALGFTESTIISCVGWRWLVSWQYQVHSATDSGSAAVPAADIGVGREIGGFHRTGGSDRALRTSLQRRAILGAGFRSGGDACGGVGAQFVSRLVG
jgi:hypothetical protein